MENSRRRLVLVVALLLLVGVTSGYVANTYAKYTASLEDKTGTAVVAKWDFKAENDANALKTFTVNLTSTVEESSLVDERIAPGTAGDFEIQLKNESSEVGVKFEIAFSDAENVPTNLVFKSGSTSFNPTEKKIVGYIAQGETLNVPVSWEWAYETTDGDDDDTEDGLAHETMTIKAKVNGIQTNPATAVTTGVTGVENAN